MYKWTTVNFPQNSRFCGAGVFIFYITLSNYLAIKDSVPGPWKWCADTSKPCACLILVCWRDGPLTKGCITCITLVMYCFYITCSNSEAAGHDSQTSLRSSCVFFSWRLKIDRWSFSICPSVCVLTRWKACWDRIWPLPALSSTPPLSCITEERSVVRK